MQSKQMVAESQRDLKLDRILQKLNSTHNATLDNQRTMQDWVLHREQQSADFQESYAKLSSLQDQGVTKLEMVENKLNDIKLDLMDFLLTQADFFEKFAKSRAFSQACTSRDTSVSHDGPATPSSYVHRSEFLEEQMLGTKARPTLTKSVMECHNESKPTSIINASNSYDLATLGPQPQENRPLDTRKQPANKSTDNQSDRPADQSTTFGAQSMESISVDPSRRLAPTPQMDARMQNGNGPHAQLSHQCLASASPQGDLQPTHEAIQQTTNKMPNQATTKSKPQSRDETKHEPTHPSTYQAKQSLRGQPTPSPTSPQTHRMAQPLATQQVVEVHVPHQATRCPTQPSMQQATHEGSVEQQHHLQHFQQQPIERSSQYPFLATHAHVSVCSPPRMPTLQTAQPSPQQVRDSPSTSFIPRHQRERWQDHTSSMHDPMPHGCVPHSRGGRAPSPMPFGRFSPPSDGDVSYGNDTQVFLRKMDQEEGRNKQRVWSRELE